MSVNARVNLALIVGIAFCVFLIFNSGRDVSQPNVEFMPDMAYSVAHETFARNPVFANGITLQAPPEGTVARGREYFGYAGGPEEAARAARELQSPVGLGSEVIAKRGAEVFGVFCQPCHGAGGNGDGPVAARGFPPPPSLFTEKANALADGQIFHIITTGQANMPAHAVQIDESDRWAAVSHVRVLQERMRVKLAEQAAAEEAKAAAAVEAAEEEAGS